MATRVIGGTWEVFNPDDVMSVLTFVQWHRAWHIVGIRHVFAESQGSVADHRGHCHYFK